MTSPQGRRGGPNNQAKRKMSLGGAGVRGANVGVVRGRPPVKGVQQLRRPAQPNRYTPSKPIGQRLQFIGGAPMQQGPKLGDDFWDDIFGGLNDPAKQADRAMTDDMREAFEKAYETVGSVRTKLRDQASQMVGGPPRDEFADEANQWTSVAVARDQVEDFTNKVRGGVSVAVGGERPELDPDRPTDATLDRVRRQVQSALMLNTWTPEERMDIVRNYREFVQRWSNGDDSLRNINNWSIKAEYARLLKQWQDEQNADDGNLADTSNGDWFTTYDGKLNSAANMEFGPGFIINKDENGWYFIQDVDDTWRQINATMRTDPAAAARMITSLAAFGSYGGAAERYASQNVVFDANGNPITARWTKDDETALKEFLQEVTVMQASGASADMMSWDEILDATAAQNQELGIQPGYGEQGGGSGWVDYGGGGGGGYGYGGGGGGQNTGISYTPADQLKQMLNGIARARLGYVLNDSDIAAFVADYHQKEAAYVNARIAGQSAMQLDPESAAAAWIESRFRDQMGAQAANNYVQQLAEFLMGGGMAAGASSNQ